MLWIFSFSSCCKIFTKGFEIIRFDIKYWWYLITKKIIFRLNIFSPCNIFMLYNVAISAGWQSGYAAACKAVYAGSIPASASMID
tara:strand:+ start:606 stop:860 length:255 start_codon:yes stop_codon:yes gene_type:complete